MSLAEQATYQPSRDGQRRRFAGSFSKNLYPVGTYSQYMESHNPFLFQTTNQIYDYNSNDELGMTYPT